MHHYAMLLIITCGALAVIGLLLCVQCWRLGDVMFSKEAIYTDARRKGFSHEQAQKIVYAVSPKVGEVGLPAWESKRRLR